MPTLKRVTIYIAIFASGIAAIFGLAAVLFTGAGIMTDNAELKKAGDDYKGTAVGLVIGLPIITGATAITVAALKRKRR